MKLVLVALVVVGALSAPAAAQAPASAADEARLYRLFLTDGSVIATFGEFARMGDRVVFTLPLTASRQALASVPAARVDWERTDRYTDALRASRYAATRGEMDFAAMSALVARTLSDVAVTPGAAAQLALAERARRTLADWPGDHFGYRADEVRQTLGLLDEVIGGLRAAAGQTSFDVSLSATTLPPPPQPLLAAPTLQDAITQALRLTELAGSPAERVALLEQLDAAIVEQGAALPAAFAGRTRADLGRALEAERAVDRRYALLRTRTVRDLERRAARGDIRGLLRTRARVVERDAALGRRRPEEIQALLASIDERLDGSRRLRLLRDQWTARSPALRRYREGVAPWLALVDRHRQALADIRALAGPSPERLSALLRSIERLAPLMKTVSVPAEAQGVHASMLSAVQLAETAARYRRRAVATNDMPVAWDASAAAAGALLLAERAARDLDRLLRPPE